MVANDLISSNGLNVLNCPYATDEIKIENAPDAEFNAYYKEVLMGPNLPPDLMPSGQSGWQSFRNNKKNELAIYQHKTDSSIYLVRSLAISNFLPYSANGYYIIFDTDNLNPNDTNFKYYRYAATSTSFRWASNDAPLQNNWQKGTDTWTELDNNEGDNGQATWEAASNMKLTSLTNTNLPPTCP